MKFGIKKKIFGGFLILSIIFLSTLILALYDIRNMNKSFKFFSSYSLQMTQNLGNIEIMITSMHRSMKDVASSRLKVDREKYLAVVNKNEKTILKIIEILHQTLILDKDKTHISEFRKDFIKWKLIRLKVSSMSENGNMDLSIKLTREEGAEYVKFLIGKLTKLRIITEKISKKFFKETTNLFDKSKIMIISILILSVILCIFIAAFLSISITKRLSVLTKAARKIAEGELEQTIIIKGNDEISWLAESFNLMTKNLSGSQKILEKNVKERTRELRKIKKEFEHLMSDLGNQVNLRTIELGEKVEKLNRSQKAMLFMVEDLNKTSNMLTTAQDKLLLKERLAVLGQFSGSISHELRNPLGVIDSSTYYLKTKLKSTDPKITEHLKRIKSSIISASSIIESLLNLTRMKKPKMEKNNLFEIISESIKISGVPEKVKIIKKFPKKDIIIICENIQLKMAFKNIIRNAAESMEEKGELKIGIHNKPDGKVEVSFKDSGRGITQKNLEKIFHPLFTTKAKGIGFGLAIAKMIMENHKGSIKADSKPGKGSTFTITLPVTESSDQSVRSKL